MPGGRPPIPFDQEIADEICLRLVESCRGLDWVLDQMRSDGYPQTPRRTTIYKWRVENKEFADHSARAMMDSADTYVDQAVEESHKPRIGRVTTTQEWGEQVKVADNVERSKLIVQTLLKRAGQLNPKKYGEKAQIEVAGKDGGPIQAAIEVTFVRPD